MENTCEKCKYKKFGFCYCLQSENYTNPVTNIQSCKWFKEKIQAHYKNKEDVQ